MESNKIDSCGYRNVSLRFAAKGIDRYCVRIHQLVAEHFLEKPVTNERIEVDHKDSNKLNNRADNLRYMTASEHRAETVNKGEHNLKGENHPNSKLKSYQVLSARNMHVNGTSIKELSQIFEISPRHMRDIISGKNWGWLSNPNIL